MLFFTETTNLAGCISRLYPKPTYADFVRYKNLLRLFGKTFNAKGCFFASSPGRVEIVGNHTDHNGGKVIGCCVNKDIIAAFSPTNNGVVTVKSPHYQDIRFHVKSVFRKEFGSSGMTKGVIAYLVNQGYKIGGFDCIIHSALPVGAGISSSAAFQLLLGNIVNALYNGGTIPSEVLAKAGQFAENEYFNKPCGLLDQGVIATGGMVAIDFAKGFCCERLPCKLSGVDIVLINTGKSHASLTDHYAAIPAEMKQVARYFGKTRLADVDKELFFVDSDKVAANLGLRPMLRAKHFFEECEIVDEMKSALRADNTDAVLRLVNKSGNSSIEQLQNCSVYGDDSVLQAVLFARSICPSCASRVHGGGFAGTVLCLVPHEHTRDFVAKSSLRYGEGNVMTLLPREQPSTVL